MARRLTIDTANTITNAGLLEALTGRGHHRRQGRAEQQRRCRGPSGSGSKVTLESNVTNTAGTLWATAGGELDVKASTITDNSAGTEQIDTGSELLVDNLHLTLNGDGSGKVVLSGTAQITGASKSDELGERQHLPEQTISGAGTISNLDLVNDAAGTIDATGISHDRDRQHHFQCRAAGSDRRRHARRSGRAERQLGDVAAEWQRQRGHPGRQRDQYRRHAVGDRRREQLDVKAATITDNLGGTEQINTGSELLVDSGHLTLNGDGTGRVVLSGTALITGAAKTNELENVNKTISGAGTISNLTLVNDTAGIIDATRHSLTIETGNTITNAGLLEATAGGTLDIQDNTIANSGGGSLGIKVDGDQDLRGRHRQSAARPAATQAYHRRQPAHWQRRHYGDTLENVNNTILSAGTIGYLGNGKLTLTNDAAGIIDANVSGHTLTIGHSAIA